MAPPAGEPAYPDEIRVKPFEGPLVPLLPPKADDRSLPRLPPRSRSSVRFGASEWDCDAFVIPAAFPRTVTRSTRKRGSPEPTAFDPNGKRDRLDTKQALSDIMRVQVQSAERQVDIYDTAELEAQEQMYQSVVRYRPRGQRTSRSSQASPGLTVVFCHANGMHKETWEPTIAEIISRLGSQTMPIEEVWSLDAATQGDSAVLNHEIIGPALSWADNGRDLLNFLVNYIDSPDLQSTEDPSLSHGDSSTPLSPSSPNSKLAKLDTVDQAVSDETRPAHRTYKGRRIVGIGHSYGGGALAFAAATLPDLFSALIFVDPVIVNRMFPRSVPSSLMGGALTRKDGWSTRQEAKDSFLAKPFFRAWDPRVLDLYVETGLKTVQGGVRLKCQPKDEALTFGDPNTTGSYRSFLRLSRLPKTLPAHFVLAKTEASVQSAENERAILERVPHATSVRVDAGHLIAQEKPGLLADHIVGCLHKWFPLSSQEQVPRARL